MVCEACANSRRAAHSAVNLAKVVGGDEQGDGITVIGQFARPADTKARKAPVKRPDAQIEAFNVAGANLVNVRVASNGIEFDAGAFGLAVTVIRVSFIQGDIIPAVNLLHDSEIETAKQMSANVVRIGTPAVRSDLNHAGNALGQVRNKVVCVAVIPLARLMSIAFAAYAATSAYIVGYAVGLNADKGKGIGVEAW